jgi:hypothetical protein
MAFTGTPVLVKVTENLFRLTGVSLDDSAVGTIGFTDKTVPAEVSLSAPNWEPYDLGSVVVGLQDSVKVSANPTVKDNNPIVFVTKTGTTHANFEIACTTSGGGESGSSGPLEIYIEFGGH